MVDETKGVESADRGKGVSIQKQRDGFLNRNRKTHQRQCQKEETPNDVSELGVVVVDLKQDKRPGIWVLDPMTTLNWPHGR
jgi:hypothetical protein